VEDVDLLHLAELPFAAEIGSRSCCLRPVRLVDLKRQMRAQAEEMRKALAVAAERSGVMWTFRVSRGSVATEILLASMDADLVILGKRGWSLSRRLGSTVRLMITRGKGMALVLQPGAKLKVPVVAIYNLSENAGRVLETAATLAEMKEGKLMVLVVVPDGERGNELQARAAEYLESRGVEGGVSVLINPGISLLAYTVRGMGPVVLPCEQTFLCSDDLCELVNVTENPVLLIR
jgi:nucleotide-binding universal stress UspA family protein